MTTPMRSVGLRLPAELVRKVDAWLARQRRPMSRGEAIRLLLSDRLKGDQRRLSDLRRAPKSDASSAVRIWRGSFLQPVTSTASPTKRMTRATSRLMAIGLLLVSAELAARALVPNGEKGGADFCMGLLMGAGIAVEIVELLQARRSPAPGR